MYVCYTRLFTLTSCHLPCLVSGCSALNTQFHQGLEKRHYQILLSLINVLCVFVMLNSLIQSFYPNCLFVFFYALSNVLNIKAETVHFIQLTFLYLIFLLSRLVALKQLAQEGPQSYPNTNNFQNNLKNSFFISTLMI